MYSKVVIVGKLEKDPIINHTKNGTAVTNLRIATTEDFVDEYARAGRRTFYHDVVVYGGLATRYTLSAGMMVVVEGSLRTTVREKEGKTVDRVEVRAQSIVPMTEE